MNVMYVDLLPDDIAPDDGKAKISCYIDEKDNLEHITMQIQAMLERLRGFMDIGAGTISFDKTKEEDWVNNWKKFFNPISLDDYYDDRERCPRDADGNLDFECLEALDVRQFNEDMTRLLAGEKVDMPSFNFKTGKREYRGRILQLKENDILVIEGIHGLNDKLSYTLPAESKFKIYISALTQLNIDEHNPLSTTDCRLLRRIVRDARTRGTTAQETIAMWKSVRRGEEKNIFPFQDSADVMFNSALLYEVAVLKVYAEPLLFQIPRDSAEYLEAKRLLKFLDYFLPLPTEGIAQSSLVREFVGGSCFNV